MNVSNRPPVNLSFKAKYLKSEALKQVVEYAVEKGKFENLNQARKNVDSCCLTTRLRFDIGEVEGRPFVTFTRYELKPEVIIPKSKDDYRKLGSFLFQSSKREDILEFAYRRLIKIGNNAPNNKMFKRVVMGK